MSVVGWRLWVLALFLGIVVGSVGAWQWQANAFTRQLAEQASAFEKERHSSAAAVIDWQEAEQARRRVLEDRVQESDATHFKELQDAKKTQARLLDRLATADLRLSVLLATPSGRGGVPAAASSGGMVHGGQRAELDSAHAQRIVAITNDGDQGLIALKACQIFVRTIMK